MRIGYARTSTKPQSVQSQIDALEAYGVDILHTEQSTGSKQLPILKAAISALQPNDELIVYRIDRLGRSVSGILKSVSEIQKKGATLVSIRDHVDTSTPHGKLVLTIYAALAEFERELIVERTRAGLEAARLQGRKGGRKRKMTDSKIESAKKLLASGMSASDVADNLDVSIPTLYRWLPAGSIDAR